MKGPEAVGIRRQAEEGCRWPSRHGSCPTSRQLDEWQRAGVWEKLHALLLAELTAAGELAALGTEIASASSSSRPLPEGVDDLPPLTRTHQVQVLDVDGGADGHVRDLAVDVLDFDFDSAIRYVSRLPDPLRRGLDHVLRRELLQFPWGRSVIRRSLRQIEMESPRHAGSVALEPSLEVVESRAHNRVVLSDLRFLTRHPGMIAAVNKRLHPKNSNQMTPRAS